LDAVEIGWFDEVVARTSAQRRNGTVDGGMTCDDDDLCGLRLLELTHELDALAIGETEVRKQHIRTLPTELNPRVADAVGPGNGKPFHARHFLQPVHDIRVIVDNQSMCHLSLGNLVFIGTAMWGPNF
jgi:hypothetical protein